jgi:pyruvate ferredoxin oxidoreductase alpha subunit
METARHAAEEMRARGEKVGVATVRSFRPFPEEAVEAAVRNARVVLVLDRDIGYGTSGMVYADVTRALYHATARPQVLNFVIGTGGKDITPKTIERCLELGRPGYRGKAVFWPDARGPREGIPYTDGLTVEG